MCPGSAARWDVPGSPPGASPSLREPPCGGDPFCPPRPFGLRAPPLDSALSLPDRRRHRPPNLPLHLSLPPSSTRPQELLRLRIVSMGLQAPQAPRLNQPSNRLLAGCGFRLTFGLGCRRVVALGDAAAVDACEFGAVVVAAGRVDGRLPLVEEDAGGHGLRPLGRSNSLGAEGVIAQAVVLGLQVVLRRAAVPRVALRMLDHLPLGAFPLLLRFLLLLLKQVSRVSWGVREHAGRGTTVKARPT